jgi:GAF domain-containing protein
MANLDEPQLIADVTTDERLDENLGDILAQMGARAVAIVPLTQAGRWVGHVGFNWAEPHEFSEQEAEIYRALVGLVSPAVANRRAYLVEEAVRAQTEDQAQRLIMLHEVSRQLSQTESLDEIYAVVAAQIPRIVSAEQSSVALLSDDDYFQVLVLQGEVGAIPADMRLPVENTAVGIAVRENRVVTVSFTSDSSFIDSQGVAEQGLSSTMCAPLMMGGRAVGALNVASPEPNAYTERDETLLLQIASLLASTMESRRLFEQAQARARREQILREITARVRGSTDPDTIMRTAVRELGAALGRPTFVRLGSAEELSQTPTAWTDGGDGKGIAPREGGE